MKKRQRLKEERPAQIIKAAIEVFSKYRYAKTNFLLIAKELDMSRSNIYLYFKDKKDLFKACVLEVSYEKRLLLSQQLFLPEKSFEEKIKLLSKILFVIFKDDKFVDFLTMIFSEATQFPEVSSVWQDLTFNMVFDIWCKIFASENLSEKELKLLFSQVISPFFLTAISNRSFGQDGVHLSLEDLSEKMPLVVCASLKALKGE